MNEEEHLAFEGRMKADPELAKEALFYRDVAGVMEMEGLVQHIDRELDEEGFFASLNLEEEEEDEETESESKPQQQAVVRRLGVRRVLAYAATVSILIVVSGLWFANQNYTDGALAQVDESELSLNILIPRGDEPESSDDLFSREEPPCLLKTISKRFPRWALFPIPLRLIPMREFIWLLLNCRRNNIPKLLPVPGW